MTAAVTSVGRMDAATWDDRHAERGPVLGRPPSPHVVEHATSLPRGQALDLACGPGADALWLATRGWQVQGVDFSAVALEQAAQAAARAPRAVRERLTWTRADVTTAELGGAGHDLVLQCFLHLPGPARAQVLARAAAALAPGGTLLVTVHQHVPRQAAIPPEVLVADLPAQLVVTVAQGVERPDTGDRAGGGWDTVVVAHRP